MTPPSASAALAAPRRTASSAVPPACDVPVIGGGINGCGIARDLAGRGVGVLLCEQDVLAWHTSVPGTLAAGTAPCS
jgi:glycerol-3-phosphate dehydrogenase